MILGITGGIATGKTTVSDLFSEFGYKVIDMDIISREVSLLPEVTEKVQTVFGKEAISNGKINRSFLRKTVFSDKKKVILLNQIMHPPIIEKTKNLIKEFEKTESLIVVVIPLLFEVGLEYMVDKILLVSSDTEIQIKRIIKRDNSSREEAVKIINSQMPVSEKKKISDYIIENNGSYEELKEKVLDLLNLLNNTGENL